MSGRLATPDTDADIELRSVLDATPRRGFIVVAGAGSGKTTSLVKALAHVVHQHGDDLRARTQRVACITYTEIAAREIAEDVDEDDLLHVSTIHSFLWTVVKPFQTDIAKWVEAKLQAKIAEAEEKIANTTSRMRPTTRERLQKDIERYRADRERLPQPPHYTYGLGSDYGRGVLGHADILAMVPDLILNRPLLARLVGMRFPYIFVDESQDTSPNVVECLKRVERDADGAVCLGFFGDPMQQIYSTGVGPIEPESHWATIPKPENFRSADRVLAVVNAVRGAADQLTQVSGLPEEKRRDGEAWFFVLPADDGRDAALEQVRAWLSEHGSAGDWTAGGPTGVKILMVLHRMAARRLGFGNLYDAFHPRGGRDAGLSDAFDAGTAWPIAPFKRVIVPLCPSLGGTSAPIQTLRAESPVLSDDAIAHDSLVKALTASRDALSELRSVVAEGGPGSVRQALKVAIRSGLVEPDPRLVAYLQPDDSPSDEGIGENARAVLDAFAQCDVAELPGYFDYVEHQSPYSTQQGTKGAEFSRVLVVLDDKEGQHPHFSYDKFFGLRSLSDTDEKNRAEGRDTVIERTRRLLYVCVSRAIDAVAVAMFAENPAAAAVALERSGLVGDGQVRLLADL